MEPRWIKEKDVDEMINGKPIIKKPTMPEGRLMREDENPRNYEKRIKKEKKGKSDALDYTVIFTIIALMVFFCLMGFSGW